MVPAGKVAGTNVVSTPPSPPALSPALADLVQLLQAGVSPEVVAAFITNSANPFYVGSAEIVYLRDLGAPPAILATLIHHDASPEIVARKQSAVAVKPLPPGVALSTPATNVFPQKPAAPAAVPNPPEPVPVSPPEAAAFTVPTAPVDTVTYEVPVETQPVSYSYFYSSLAPYGTWSDVPGYGYCWQPTVAVYSPTWRPYCDGGRWLWSDRGWYWYSSYSWGWAPFHYGRWCQPAGYGWVWQPGTCWGPSWVSWRYSSGYCGWAPLPPSACWTAGVGFYSGGLSVGIGYDFGLPYSSYVFCPTTRFCDPKPYDHCVPSDRTPVLYKDSTVVNNYVLGNNNTIINNGVGFDKVAKVSKGDIRKVKVSEAGLAKDLTPRHERLSDDGATLTVHRPSLAASGAGSTVAPSGRRLAGVSGPRVYSDTPAGAGGLKSSPAAGGGSIPKAGSGFALAPTAGGGAGSVSRPGQDSVVRPSAASATAATEPRSIKPIIIRRTDPPMLAGGPSTTPAPTGQGYAAYDRPVTAAPNSVPMSGEPVKPAVGAGKPAVGVSRNPSSPSVVKPAAGVSAAVASVSRPGGDMSVPGVRPSPGGASSKPVTAVPVTRAVSPAASSAYVKPVGGVSPARPAGSPVRSVPATSAPRVSPGYSAPRPAVSVSSGSPGGSRPAAPASSGSSRAVSAPSASSGKVGR